MFVILFGPLGAAKINTYGISHHSYYKYTTILPLEKNTFLVTHSILLKLNKDWKQMGMKTTLD